MKKSLRPLISIGKAILAILPIVWIFGRLDRAAFAQTFATAAWWTFPVITVVGLSLMALQGLRWWFLIRACSPEVSLGRAMYYHFTSLFYSLILPTSYAQDVMRSALLSREADYSVVWGATWVCRLLGLVVLILFSAAGLATIDRNLISDTLLYTIISGFVLLLVLTIMSFSKRTTRPIRLLMGKFIPEKFMKIPEKIRDGVYAYRHKRADFLAVLLMTIVMQAIGVVNSSLLIKGVAGRFHFAEVFTFIPLIEIATMSLPLTPNGLGIRESLTAMMFQHIGLSKEELGVYVVLGLYVIALRLVGALPVYFPAMKRMIKRIAARDSSSLP